MKSIGMRIIVAMSAMIALLIVLCAIALLNLTESNRRLEDLYTQETVALEVIDDAKSAMYRMRIDMMEHVLADRQESRDEIRKEFEVQRDRLHKRLDEFRATRLSAQEESLVAEFETAAASFSAFTLDQVMVLSDAGDDAGAAALARGEAADVFRVARAAANKLMDYAVERGRVRMSNSETDYDRSLLVFGTLVALGVALSLGVAIGLIRSISTPLKQMTAAMSRLAQRDWTTGIPGLGRADEVGEMAAAVQVFKDNGIRNDELRQQKERDELERARKQEVLGAAVADFQAAVTGIVDTLGSAAERMSALASSLADTALVTTERAGTVAAASEQASVNVQVVSSAAEELTASVGEISGQAFQASSITKSTVEATAAAASEVAALQARATQIGSVVELINRIAAQTNLLALNATIEAARAGEAGKGFAVVAGEVKTLASQTARATDEISREISAIQASTNSTVVAIGGVGKLIQDVADASAAIAAAVEEQGAATREIARNVEEASRGTTEVSSNISDVSSAARHTQSISEDILASARELETVATGVRKVVHNFIEAVRAA